MDDIWSTAQCYLAAFLPYNIQYLLKKTCNKQASYKSERHEPYSVNTQNYYTLTVTLLLKKIHKILID